MKRIKGLKITLLFGLFIIGHVSNAQLDLSFKAEKLGTTVNSEYSETAPVLSKDGNRLYFVRINHPDNHFGISGSQDIWYSDKKGNSWTEAKRLSDTVNVGKYNAIYDVLPDGELLIANIYTKTGVLIKRGFSIVSVEGDEYGIPKPLKVTAFNRMSDGDAASASINADGTLLFMSLTKWRTSNNNRIYVSKHKKNKWSKPKKLKGVNNKKGNEAPFITPDGKTMYFSSKRENAKGVYDIYQSEKVDLNEDRKWSSPVKVEGEVSSTGFDSFFTLDEKGEYAYFSSNRGGGKSEIYRLKVKDIRDFVKVEGVVMNETTGKLLDPTIPFELIISSTGPLGEKSIFKPENLKINKETSSYSFNIPFGVEYDFEVLAEDHESVSSKIDLKGIESYTEMKQDVSIKSNPVSKISGTITNALKNGKQIDYENVAVFVNGVMNDSVIIKPNGEYFMDLPIGEKYNIEAKQEGFHSRIKEVDLSEVKTGKDLRLDLQMEEIPEIYSFLNAKVYNKKDSTHIPPLNYDVYLNGSKLYGNIISKTIDEFQLDLEHGTKYFVMVKAPGYIESHDSIDFRYAKVKEHITRDFYLTPIEVGATVQIENIYFDLGKAILRPESYVELDRLVELLNDNPHLTIEVSGHTDNRGNAYLNKKLSGERASSVRKYLIEKGIKAERLTSQGYGFDKPMAPNDTEENRARNRRVEFTILSNDY